MRDECQFRGIWRPVSGVIYAKMLIFRDSGRAYRALIAMCWVWKGVGRGPRGNEMVVLPSRNSDNFGQGIASCWIIWLIGLR
jgi:hypothetical protein